MSGAGAAAPGQRIDSRKGTWEANMGGLTLPPCTRWHWMDLGGCRDGSCGRIQGGFWGWEEVWWLPRRRGARCRLLTSSLAAAPEKRWKSKHLKGAGPEHRKESVGNLKGRFSRLSECHKLLCGNSAEIFSPSRERPPDLIRAWPALGKMQPKAADFPLVGSNTYFLITFLTSPPPSPSWFIVGLTLTSRWSADNPDEYLAGLHDLLPQPRLLCQVIHASLHIQIYPNLGAINYLWMIWPKI